MSQVSDDHEGTKVPKIQKTEAEWQYEAIAFYIQTWAQAHLDASRTALILATEPAWALVAAVVLAGQRLDLVQALGAVLVLAAIVGHELAPLLGRSLEKNRIGSSP